MGERVGPTPTSSGEGAVAGGGGGGGGAAAAGGHCWWYGWMPVPAIAVLCSSQIKKTLTLLTHSHSTQTNYQSRFKGYQIYGAFYFTPSLTVIRDFL